MSFPISQNVYGIAVGSASTLVPVFANHDPTSSNIQYPIQQRWVNTATQAIWVLESFSSIGGVVQATWRALAPIVLSTVDPTSSNYLYPLGQPWLNTTSDAYWILVAVSGTTATWENLTGGVGPVLTIDTDSGTASPAAGVITITGVPTGLTTAGSGSTVNLTGTLVVGHGGTGATTLTGLLTGNGTSAVTATPITQYNVLTAAAANAPNSVAPSATSGVPLISQGSAAQPIFGTALVAGGGTGLTTAGSNTSCLLATGTTATGNFQIIANGSAGQVLTAQASGLPQWSTGFFSTTAFYFYLATSVTNKTGNGAVYQLGTGTALTQLSQAGSSMTTAGVFTAPATGWYQFSLNIPATNISAAMTTGSTFLLINGTQYSFGSGLGSNNVVNASGIYSLSSSHLLPLSSGDTVTANVEIQNGAGNTAGVQGGALTSFISIATFSGIRVA